MNASNALTATTPATVSNGFLAKYDKQGNLLWNLIIASIGADEVTAIHVDGNSIYITGEIGGVCSFPTSPSATSLGTASTKSWFVAKVTDNGTSAQMDWVKLLTGGKAKDICVGELNDVYVVSSTTTGPFSSKVEKFSKNGAVGYVKSFANEVIYSKVFVNKGRLMLGGEGWGPYMRLDPSNSTQDYSIGEGSADQYLAMYNEYDTLDCKLKQPHLDLESSFSFFLKGAIGGIGKDLNGDTKELHTSLRVNSSYKDLLCKFNGSLMLAYNNSAPYTLDILGKGFATVNADNAMYMISNYTFYNYISTPTGNGGGSGIIGNQNFVVIKIMESPDGDLTADLTHCQVDDEVVFTAQSSGIINSYNWYFGAGASPATAIGIGPHTVTYTSDGTKSVSLKVSGEAGTDSTAKANIVYVYKKITPDFFADNLNPIKNQTVTFTSNSTGTIDNYVWLFGTDASPDLAYGSGPHEVTYSSAGPKTVSLQVSSGTNSQFVEKTDLITVQNVTSILPSKIENEIILSIFPNPTKDHILIESKLDKLDKVEVMDSQGKVLKTVNASSTQVKVQLNDLNAGIYIIKVVSGTKVNIQQIILE